MNLIPTPVLPKVSAAESQPAVGGPSLTNSVPVDQPTGASFPAALAQANQQAASAKTLPNEKAQSEKSTLPSLATTDNEEGTRSQGEGIEEFLVTLLAPITQQVGEGEEIPQLEVNGDAETLSSTLNAEIITQTVNASSLVAAPPASALVESESESVDTIPQVSLSISLPSVKNIKGGEPPSQVLPNSLPNFPQPAVPSSGQIQPEVVIGRSNEPEEPPLILPREQALPLQSGTRIPLPNVPLSFVNGGFQQGQVVIDPVNTAPLSPTIHQHIQGSFTLVSNTPTVTVQDAMAISQVPGGGLGEGETAEHEFGAGDHQENEEAFANKHQDSKPIAGGFSMATESGSDVRVGESASSGRGEAMVDRSRMMNILSPQRMQMEVMLSDETKVHVDVAVTQHQVSAQLLTDQLMLRNLALQHEPQLDAQLASAGLDLKQFGAEVSEHGLFGQHLSDSSSQEFTGRGGSDAQELPNTEILVGAGVEADGRVHFVA